MNGNSSVNLEIKDSSKYKFNFKDEENLRKMSVSPTEHRSPAIPLLEITPTKEDDTKSFAFNNSEGLIKFINKHHTIADNSYYSNNKQVITLENVQKTYLLGIDGITAVRGISMSIYQGEFVLIVGSSGGGKSSLLNMIGTIDQPSRGNMK